VGSEIWPILIAGVEPNAMNIYR